MSLSMQVWHLVEENMRWIDGSRYEEARGRDPWNRDENELADVKKLIKSLCKLSNKIRP